MKPLRSAALTLLLCLTATACAAPKINELEPVEPRSDTDGVTISRVAHPITLPLESLAGATFIGSNGEVILYKDLKGLFATVVTSDDWGNPPIQMNQTPRYIFERDLSRIEDTDFRAQLEGIIRMNLESGAEKETSTMTLGDITAYIAFSPEKTVIMLTSPNKPDLFTQLVLDHFSWSEIEHEILKGIGGQ